MIATGEGASACHCWMVHLCKCEVLQTFSTFGGSSNTDMGFIYVWCIYVALYLCRVCSSILPVLPSPP